MAREQRRLAAIVSSDLAGYSRLMGEDESGTLAALKAVRRKIVDPRIAKHGGRIVKTTGDGLLSEFASAVDAVRCAIETQVAMAAFNADRPKERRIDFRIGVNVGDIIIDDDSPGDALSHGLLAEALCDVGDPKNAAEAARRALELDRNSVQALGPVAGATSFIGDPRKALEALERVLDLAPAHYGRAAFVSVAALLQWKLGNPARAVALADEGAGLKRESALGPLVQAVTMVGAGRLEDASAALARARSLRPDLGPPLALSILPFADPADRAALLDALRQGGLNDA